MALSYEDRVEIFYGFYAVLTKLNDMSVQLEDLQKELERLRRRDAMDVAQINQKLADLKGTVEADTNATNAASVLLDNLAQLIRDNTTDPAALEAIAASIDAANTSVGVNNQLLSDAITRNTPSAPATGETTPPTEGGTPTGETPPEGQPTT